MPPIFRKAPAEAAPQTLDLRYFSIAVGVAVVHFLTGVDILASGIPANRICQSASALQKRAI
jgi:hypothetical protein